MVKGTPDKGEPTETEFKITVKAMWRIRRADAGE